MSGEQPSSAFWYSRPGKYPLSAHLLSAHFRSLPGKAPTLRAPLSRPKSTPPSATGLREPPYKPAWLRETPYATIGVFPVVSGVFTTKFPARAGMPLTVMRPRVHYPDSDKYGGWPTNHFIYNGFPQHYFPVLWINLLPF